MSNNTKQIITEWHKTDERLPHKSDDYLVLFETKREDYTYTSFMVIHYSIKYKMFNCFDSDMSEHPMYPVAWAYLPSAAEVLR